MIPHQPIFTNIQDRFNLGDMLCNAKEIFPEFKDSPMVDFREVTDGPEPLIALSPLALGSHPPQFPGRD